MTTLETLRIARSQARRALDRAECGTNQYAINEAFAAFAAADKAFQAANKATAAELDPAAVRALNLAD